MVERIGILHPGDMGISVAAAALRSGHEVYWASEGRSEATRARAASQRLRDGGTLGALCRTCTVIVSVCPPHAARAVARGVAEHGFTGLYLDANAVSPDHAREMAETLSQGGASFVDGGIIGGPAWRPGTTVLYLSGERAADLEACFAAGPLATRVLGPEVGRASALKMCYAALTKGTAAMLTAVLSAAEALGVRGDLYRQWSDEDAASVQNAERRVANAALKAWRFAGEMEEIAATLGSAGLPSEFHRGAAELYRRLEGYRGRTEPPSIDEILAASCLAGRT